MNFFTLRPETSTLPPPQENTVTHSYGRPYNIVRRRGGYRLLRHRGKVCIFVGSIFSSQTVVRRYKVKLQEGFDNILVVDGVPVIDKSKLERLVTKIAKEFTRKGAVIKADDISVPFSDSTGKSVGYVPYYSYRRTYVFLAVIFSSNSGLPMTLHWL